MDCRKSLVLAFGITCSSFGCVTTKLPLASEEATQPGPAATQATSSASRNPKPATCVAFGDFRAKQAGEPNVAPSDRGQLRDQARRAYQQAIQLEPHYLPAYRALARLYSDQGDFGRAVDTYEKALKISSKEASVWFDLGMCYSRQKMWDPALKSLQTAVRLDPENRNYVTTFAYCLARTGLLEDSYKVFTTVMGSAEAHFEVARMAHHLQRDDLCRKQLLLALHDKPDLAAAQRLLSQVGA